MNRIWTIAWKEIFLTYSDRSFLLILVTPLVLSTIIGFAFGGLSGNTLNIGAIDVAIVNLDEGTTANNQTFNYGTIFTDIFIPTDSAVTDANQCVIDGVVQPTEEQQPLSEIIQAVALISADAARAGVDDGTYQVAIIIPPDFSQNLAPVVGANIDDTPLPKTTLEVYASSGDALSGDIVRGIVAGISQQFVTGNVAVAATLNTFIAESQARPGFAVRFLAAQAAGTFQPDFSCAFSDALNTVTIQNEPLTAIQKQSNFVQILVQIGSAQALFFALFTSLFGLLSVYDERKNGTLQRMMVAPMPPSYILVGKILGNYLNVLLQVVLLMLGLTLIASLVEGRLLFIWGDLAWVSLLVVVISLSVSGVGSLIVGFARTQQQAQVVGPLINSGFAILGGAFGFTLPAIVGQFSPIYWGSQAFLSLANGNTDIGLNLLVLLVQGGVMFIVGSWLFNKRSGI